MSPDGGRLAAAFGDDLFDNPFARGAAEVHLWDGRPVPDRPADVVPAAAGASPSDRGNLPERAVKEAVRSGATR
jgi:hypothetical protein